ncbi:hypothetical protein XELAEV_18033675mg [Xenopus laevis]|uniref:Uncharacterized protein n=1 Tax=Xenopus laevis TaxID=8355 RepID=A0A974HE70_XENLA|nr:hypothetical protein XELAEV_18033675mg [Xenopus laevis]
MVFHKLIMNYIAIQGYCFCCKLILSLVYLRYSCCFVHLNVVALIKCFVCSALKVIIRAALSFFSLLSCI